MANPLKVLAALSASAGAVVSGSAGLKIKQGNLTVDVGNILASNSIVSASQLAITGLSSLAEVSASGLHTSGDVFIGGNLTVIGTPTTIESNIVNIGDKNLNLGTGSNDLSELDGGGLTIGSGSNQVELTYNNASTALKANVDLDLSGSKVYKINGTSVLSSTTLGSGVTTSSLTSVGTLNGLAVSGETYLSGNVKLGDATGDAITVSGTLAVSSSSGQVNDVVSSIKSLEATLSGASLVHAASYDSLRIVLTHTLVTDGEDSVFELTESNVVTGLSASTDANLATVLAGASFDVAVRPASSNYWTNDLVSVHVTGSVSGSSVYPKFVVSAPALEAAATIRLIVVNENANQIA